MRGFATFGVIVAIIGAVIVLYIPAYLWLFPMLHDRTLNTFSQELLTIPVPNQTQEVDRLTKVGHQSGNSDHCDYLAAILLKTDLSKSEIEKYYKNNYRGKSTVNFYWFDEPHEPGIGAVNPTGIYTLNDWVDSKAKATGSDLMVYIFEGGMTSALDLRCS